MAKAFNDWVESDVAIEIIGKMIAEENERLLILIADYRKKGHLVESAFVQNDERYRQHRTQISQYGAEIQAIYNGQNMEALLKKVQDIYAPHLLNQASPQIAH